MTLIVDGMVIWHELPFISSSLYCLWIWLWVWTDHSPFQRLGALGMLFRWWPSCIQCPSVNRVISVTRFILSSVLVKLYFDLKSWFGSWHTYYLTVSEMTSLRRDDVCDCVQGAGEVRSRQWSVSNTGWWPTDSLFMWRMACESTRSVMESRKVKSTVSHFNFWLVFCLAIVKK